MIEDERRTILIPLLCGTSLTAMNPYLSHQTKKTEHTKDSSFGSSAILLLRSGAFRTLLTEGLVFSGFS